MQWVRTLDEWSMAQKHNARDLARGVDGWASTGTIFHSAFNPPRIVQCFQASLMQDALSARSLGWYWMKGIGS